jgi:DNA-directed RNA polymerase I, II, and III subunit RPABC5
MIIPIKCFTCGMVLADKYRYYQEKVREIKLAKGVNVENVVYLTKEKVEKITPENETSTSENEGKDSTLTGSSNKSKRKFDSSSKSDQGCRTSTFTEADRSKILSDDREVSLYFFYIMRILIVFCLEQL